MVVTTFTATVLHAAIVRDGVWFLDQNGNTTDFYHNCCYNRQHHVSLERQRILALNGFVQRDGLWYKPLKQKGFEGWQYVTDAPYQHCAIVDQHGREQEEFVLDYTRFNK